MKRLLTTAIILMALLMTSLAQSSKWNSYRSYYDVSHIEPAGNKVFVLASNSMFSYNLNDQTIDEYMQSNGLSSNIISRIAWSSAAKQLFIVYDDYNFDFLDTEGNIVNIASYKTKYTTEDKTINDIYIDGVYAYLATAFGVMKINLRNKVIDNTFRLNCNISTVLVKDNIIYAMSKEKETLFVGKQTDNLLDSNSWSQQPAPKCDHLYISKGLIIGFEVTDEVETVLGLSYKTKVYTMNQYDITPNGITSTKLLETKSERQRNNNNYVEPVYNINCQNEHIIFTKDNNVYEVYGNSVDNYVLPDMECLTYDNANRCYWVCSSEDKSIVQLKKQGDTTESSASASPFTVTASGIRVNNLKYNWWFSLRYRDGYLIGTDGGLSGDNQLWLSEKENRKAAIQMLKPDGTWVVFEDDIKQYTNITYSDICCSDIDPLDSTHVVVGSRSGVYEFKDGKFLKHWTYTNSPLTTSAGNSFLYVEVPGVLFEDNGDLWVLNGYSNNCILKLRHDGEWENHTPKELVETNMGNVRNTRHPHFDSKGRLWFCVDHGFLPAVYCFNPTNGDLLSFCKPFANQDGNVVNVVDGVHALDIDKDDNVWVGTDVGLFMIPAGSTPTSSPTQLTQLKIARNDGTNFADYLLADTDISAIAVDGANRKWIGTFNNGVYLISSDNQQVLLHFTMENSPLLADYIESIAINSNTGVVFFGTKNGLCSYQSDATQTYDEMTKDNVHAYPNPVHPDYTGPITITGLTMNADVKILSSSGYLVAEGRSSGGSFEWDGRDLNGRRVASGVYMVHTATSEGKKGIVCKVAIVN